MARGIVYGECRGRGDSRGVRGIDYGTVERGVPNADYAGIVDGVADFCAIITGSVASNTRAGITESIGAAGSVEVGTALWKRSRITRLDT